MKRLNIVILVCNSLVLLLTVARLLAVDNIYYQLAILVIVAILLIVSMVLTMVIISGLIFRDKARKPAPIAVMTDAFRNALCNYGYLQGESEEFAGESETLTWSKWRQVSADDPRLRKRTEISQDIMGNVYETERFELDVSEGDNIP